MPDLLPSSPNGERRGVVRTVLESKLVRVFSYPDFRLLWLGAFVSFTGSWIQKVAEGYFVYELTRDEWKLAMISFCNSVPVFVFGFVAGSFADTLNKRMVLVVTQALYALGSIYLAAATYFGFIQYWHIVAVALILGFVGCVEMPTRQSMVSRVVPPEELASAVPVNAMTFNVARICGPAIGVLVLTKIGVPACYLLNGLSFLALIWAVIAIRSDLSVAPRAPQPIMDLILDGARYTWREPRLRTLLILESITAVFGVYYVPLVPAYVDQALGLGTATGAHADVAKAAIGSAYTAIGIGAMTGLVVITSISDTPHKAQLLRLSMFIVGVGLVGLSFVRDPLTAYILMGFTGGATIVQFNSTNALFQLLSPERLRGRVLSMHIWALNGLSPFGVLFAGWLARLSRLSAEPGAHLAVVPTAGVRFSFLVGGLCVLVGAVGALLSTRGLSGLSNGPSTE